LEVGLKDYLSALSYWRGQYNKSHSFSYPEMGFLVDMNGVEEELVRGSVSLAHL
jgi:hypothetical protein